MSKNLLTFILFSVVLFLSVYSVWRISQPRILSPEEMKVNGFYQYGSFEELRDFQLINHNNEAFSKEDLKANSLSFLYFGYSSCPTECPVMMSVMRQVYDKMETDEIAYYLISFDPEIDTIDRLKSYVTAFNPEFMGVSGEISEVVKLGYQLGVEKLAPMENHMNQRIISHTNHLIVVNSDAEVIGIFKAPFESSSMTLVIKSLLSSQ
jgi:protein SCO1/2|tara:strand:+ start:1092 stop:1715 length:624 start_codon:yes stop_codon:yes gene_type:complete